MRSAAELEAVDQPGDEFRRWLIALTGCGEVGDVEVLEAFAHASFIERCSRLFEPGDEGVGDCVEIGAIEQLEREVLTLFAQLGNPATRLCDRRGVCVGQLAGNLFDTVSIESEIASVVSRIGIPP